MTRAAARLGVTQPAMSGMLTRIGASRIFPRPVPARRYCNALAIAAFPRLQCVTFLKGHACTMNSKQHCPASRWPS
ncbi:helix-turn-helix domain-containing protein [Pseudoduganella dura]|uniref:helix-turn-helix domain-containing protein n=1 Tax=Pseudoduganella dura TaxID=321982 RepID=UPI003FCCF2BB